MEPPFLRATSSIPTVFYKSSASTTLPTAPAEPRHHQHASTSNTDTSASQHPSVHRRSSSRAPTPTLRARADLVPDGAGESLAACVRLQLDRVRQAACSASPRWCAHTNTLVWAPSRSSPQAPRHRASWSSVRATPPPCPSSSPFSSPRCSPPPQNAISTPTSPLLPEASRALRTALFTRHLQRILDTLPTPSAVPDPLGAVAAKSLPFAVLHSLIVSGNRHVAQSPQPFPSPTSTPVRPPDVQSVPCRELPPSSSSSGPTEAGVDALPALSAFFTRYLSGLPNPIFVSHATSLTRLPL
ncbi:hypothetical protein B0H14DRAFT_3858950 [Mycena olivaceomarginata]|nr:hypothetical protein B0H14DRAFT_3858950 [Mycena olivaceomarginata]